MMAPTTAEARSDGNGDGDGASAGAEASGAAAPADPPTQPAGLAPRPALLAARHAAAPDTAAAARVASAASGSGRASWSGSGGSSGGGAIGDSGTGSGGLRRRSMQNMGSSGQPPPLPQPPPQPPLPAPTRQAAALRVSLPGGAAAGSIAAGGTAAGGSPDFSGFGPPVNATRATRLASIAGIHITGGSDGGAGATGDDDAGAATTAEEAVPPASPAARLRWHRAVAAVGAVRSLHVQASTLVDRAAEPQDRLFAALSLTLQRAAWERLMASGGGGGGGGGGAAGIGAKGGVGRSATKGGRNNTSTSTSADPHRRLLRHYLEKKRAGTFANAWERLEAELVITGTHVFDWCTPARMGEHWPLFTCAFTAAAGLLFAFMAGNYPAAAALEAVAAAAQDAAAAAAAAVANVTATLAPAGSQQANTAGSSGVSGSGWALGPTAASTAFGTSATTATAATAAAAAAAEAAARLLPTRRAGPAFLADVLLRGGAAAATSLPESYLRAWGGRYGPDLHYGGVSQAYRWLTGPALHVDFRHCAANLALTAALGLGLEVRYGAARVAAVWLAAAVGGGLLSAAVESPCRVVVGASGGAFGLLGLFAADTALHWRRLRRPLLRCALVGVLLGLLVFALAAQQHTAVSHMSHLGGLACGLLPGLLALPHLPSQAWEAALPGLGLLGLAAWFAVLPAYVYAVRLPAAAPGCPPLEQWAPEGL